MEGFWAGLKVLIATGLIVVAAAWTARVAGKRMAVYGRGRHMTVVETISLGSQRGLFLVSVAQRLLVVGASRDGLALLAEIPPAEAQSLGIEIPGGDESRADRQQRPPAGGGFAGGDQLLSRLTAQIGDLRRKLGGNQNRATAPLFGPGERLR